MIENHFGGYDEKCSEGFDWDTGKEVADIALPDSYKFNCAGGFIYPLPDGRLFAGGMFGPTIIALK